MSLILSILRNTVEFVLIIAALWFLSGYLSAWQSALMVAAYMALVISDEYHREYLYEDDEDEDDQSTWGV